MNSTPPKILNGYVLENEFYHFSGNAQWTFAEKDEKQWFVKRFTDPVRPDKHGELDPEYIEQLRKAFHRFCVNKLLLYAAVNCCDNGNIVTIESVFCAENRCHVVTERIPVDETFTMEEIVSLRKEEKYLLMKVLADSVARLHQKHIVYADIRPDNVLLKRGIKGNLIPKLIDFDGSYFEGKQPPAEGLPISVSYLAPETAKVYYEGETLRLSTKVDVFSLGLLFHQYWTGELPWFDENEYDYAFDAAMNGPGLEISPHIPQELASLLSKMFAAQPKDRPDMNEVLRTLKQITGDVGEHESETEGKEPKSRGFVTSIAPKQPVDVSKVEGEEVQEKLKMLNYITKESEATALENSIVEEIMEAEKLIKREFDFSVSEEDDPHETAKSGRKEAEAAPPETITDSFYDGLRPVTHI